MAVEEYGRLLKLLSDDGLREVARRLGCGTRTVDRPRDLVCLLGTGHDYPITPSS